MVQTEIARSFPTKCIPQRYIVSFLCFSGLALSYIMRFCLSLAITVMVASHSTPTSSNTTLDSCPSTHELTLGSLKKDGEFHWSEKTQGLILSSFFWGYVLTQIPGGLLSEKFGGKTILGVGVFMSSVGTLLTPIISRLGGPPLLIAVRVFIGLGQGLIYPALHVVTSHWVPTQERGRLGTLVFSGANFGNIISMSLSGLLLGTYDWPLIFYIYGGCGMLWIIFWYFFGFSKPSLSPFLSDTEQKYLEQYSEAVNMSKSLKTPWKPILLSVPMWGLVIGQIGHDWGLFTIVTDLPKYMKSVMHYSIVQNGFLLSLAYVLMWIVAMTSGGLADWLLKKGYFSVTTNRKIFTTFASLGPALGILGATYSGCDRDWASTFFIFGMGLMGFFYPSLKVNALDLSPNFAGTISALVIGIGAISGIITPYLVGLLTPDSTLLQWRLVFWIAAIVLAITNLFYVFMGSGEVQEWNNPPNESKDDKSKLASPRIGTSSMMHNG